MVFRSGGGRRTRPLGRSPSAVAQLSVVAGLLFAWTGATLPASAQILVVRVTDEAGVRSLQGVLVIVEGRVGERPRRLLSDAQGRVVFPGLTAAVYRVRGERIGLESTEATVEVGREGTSRVELALAETAIAIEGLSVAAEARCETLPEARETVASVWEEARKGLEVARWTTEVGAFEFRTRWVSRDVDQQTGQVSNLETRTSRSFSRTPYVSRPVANLLGEGFIQDQDEVPGGERYFAPDAAVLLSDEFLETHCMRVRTRSGDGGALIGLAFEPTGARPVADIAGTLWIDPARWALRSLEYGYVPAVGAVETHGSGGELHFEQLPNGAWIVQEWVIRMPLLAMARDAAGMETVYQYGIRDQGGTVLSIRDPRSGTVISGPGDAFGTDLAAPVGAPAAELLHREEAPPPRIEVRVPEPAFEIEGLLVSVEQRSSRLADMGFYDRRDSGTGTFLDGEEIAAQLPSSLEEILRPIPGVRIAHTVTTRGGRPVVVIRGCLPAIYIDGVQARRGTPFESKPDREPVYLSDLVNPEDIEGIEVYTSPAELPAQYGGTGAECGVLLVWTR